MQIRHLDHLNMSVHSLKESIEWYGRIFGFEMVEEGVSPDGVPWAIIRAGDAMLCIYEHPGHQLFSQDELVTQKRLGIRHFSLRVADKGAWLKVTEDENLNYSYASPTEYAHSSSWYVLDPNGYEIEVVLWDEDKVNFTHAQSLSA